MTLIKRLSHGLGWSVIVLLGAITLSHAGGRHDDDDWSTSVKSEETIEKAFSVSPSGAAVLELDNVYGSIDVVGTSGHQVQVSIAKTIRAASQSDLDRAKTEVTLDVTQDGDSVRLYVNGPFRCNQDCYDCWREKKRQRYVVTMDFKVRVPERIALRLKTVTEGRVTVENVIGDYQVGNVNGEITMRNVGGSGNVKTVNGAVKVSFRENPREASEFVTVNGDVELVFARSLAADFRFKTFNGAIYSDFSMTALPPAAATVERKNGRFVYRADRFTGGRVGSGGPEITLQNLNGDIRVLESAS
jgi:flavin-binding protein dodecin